MLNVNNFKINNCYWFLVADYERPAFNVVLSNGTVGGSSLAPFGRY